MSTIVTYNITIVHSSNRYCKECCAEWLYYYLKNKQKLDISSEGRSSRVSSRDQGKCTGFYTKSMKASRDKKINQLDGFNHNKV